MTFANEESTILIIIACLLCPPPLESPSRASHPSVQRCRWSGSAHWRRVACNCGRQRGSHSLSCRGSGRGGGCDHSEQQTVLRDHGPRRGRWQTPARAEESGEGKEC